MTRERKFFETSSPITLIFTSGSYNLSKNNLLLGKSRVKRVVQLSETSFDRAWFLAEIFSQNLFERGARPFFKSLFVYRVFLRFESQLSTKGNHQIPERIFRWQRCSAVIGPDQLPSRALPSRNFLSAINERTFGKRSNLPQFVKKAEQIIGESEEGGTVFVVREEVERVASVVD